MEGVQVLSLIEKKLGVAIPGELMFEDDTTLRSLVPLVRNGGAGLENRVSLVDGAVVAAAVGLLGQTEAERLTKVERCTVKASWRDGSFPVGCLSPTSFSNDDDGEGDDGDEGQKREKEGKQRMEMAAKRKKRKKGKHLGGGDDVDGDLETAHELAAAALADYVVASSLPKALKTGLAAVLGLSCRKWLIGNVVGVGVAHGGSESDRRSGSSGGSGGESTGSSLFTLSTTWVFLGVASLLWLMSCLLAAARHRRRAQVAVDAVGVGGGIEKRGSKGSAVVGAGSARAKLLSGFGCKILYESFIDPLDGPFLVAGFQPSSFLSKAAPSPARARSQAKAEMARASRKGQTQSGGQSNNGAGLSSAARQSMVSRAVAKAEADRGMMRSHATAAVAAAVDGKGGLVMAPSVRELIGSHHHHHHHHHRHSQKHNDSDLSDGWESDGEGENGGDFLIQELKPTVSTSGSEGGHSGGGNDSSGGGSGSSNSGGGGHPLLPFVEVLSSSSSTSSSPSCSFALVAAAAVHRATFGTGVSEGDGSGGEEEEVEIASGKSSTNPASSASRLLPSPHAFPVAFLQGGVTDLEQLSNTPAVSSAWATTTSTLAPSSSGPPSQPSSIPPPPPSTTTTTTSLQKVVFGGLGSPLGLRFFGTSGGGASAAGGGGGGGATQVGLQGPAAAARALKEGGTVFYPACGSDSGGAYGDSGGDGGKEKAATKGAAVGAAAACAVAKAASEVVLCAMKHGASVVPCLTLGDAAAENALLNPASSLIGAAAAAAASSSSSSSSTSCASSAAETSSVLSSLQLLLAVAPPMFSSWLLAMLLLLGAFLSALDEASADNAVLQFVLGSGFFDNARGRILVFASGGGSSGSSGDSGSGSGNGGGSNNNNNNNSSSKSSNSLAQVSLSVAYGKPIAVPHTSCPHPKVAAECTKAVLASLQALEQKYAGLHRDH
jgi:hypothetical protein